MITQENDRAQRCRIKAWQFFPACAASAGTGLALISSLFLVANAYAQSSTSGNTDATQPAVVTRISNVHGASEVNGGKALIAYTARHDVNSHVDAGITATPLPGARIASADYVDAFSGAYGNSVFAGAWLAPHAVVQLNPTSQLFENTYFFDQIPGQDPFGNLQGTAMEAGDHVEVAMENVTADAPMTWDAPRGAAGGQLTWETAQDSRNVTASYEAITGDMDVVFVRADIVARGGDVDARTQAVTLEPLVINLPKTYAATATASYIVATFFPAAQYLTMSMRMEPQSGKAFLEATVQGYIPAATEYTLPSGAQIKEWHLPLNAVITIKPTGGLTGNSSIALPARAHAVAAVGDQIQQFDAPAGGRVIATTEGTINFLPAGDSSGPGAGSPSLSASESELATASAVNHLSSTAVDLASGDYDAIVDPDYRGEGVLALRSLTRLLTGTTFADVMAVPFVLVDGTPITLDRTRLVDLRVYPDCPFISVQFIAYGETVSPSRTLTIFGSAYDAGLVVQAVYDLGDDRYAFVQTSATHFIEPPVYIPIEAYVVSLATGSLVASAPVDYLEVPFSGPITYNSETRATEFSAALDANSPNNTSLGLGNRSFIGSVFSSSTSSDGQVTVVRAPGALDTVPQPNSGSSLDGRPVALYYTHAPTAVTNPSGWSIALLELDSDNLSVQPQPKAIDEQCTAPEINDGPIADAPPAQDVQSGWFDVDDANLYASVQIADLPAASPSGTTYSWAIHWRNEHTTSYARAILDENGNFSFEFGPYNANTTLPSYNKTANLTGDYKLGTDGVVRMWIPRSLLGYREGDLLRDTSARSQVSQNGKTLEIDQAPDGANAVYGTGGDYLVKKCGSTATATLVGLESRKVHGNGATFDLDLSLTGMPGIECRSGGATGAYTLIFTFLDALTSVDRATVSSGTGSVASSNIDSNDAHNYLVNLTGVSNAQYITVTLSNVTDAAGNVSAAVAGSMGVLLGDTNADGVVNSADIAQTKSQSGQPVTDSNFREDVNSDGFINSADIGFVKSNSGTALP